MLASHPKLQVGGCPHHLKPLFYLENNMKLITRIRIFILNFRTLCIRGHINRLWQRHDRLASLRHKLVARHELRR